MREDFTAREIYVNYHIIRYVSNSLDASENRYKYVMTKNKKWKLRPVHVGTASKLSVKWLTESVKLSTIKRNVIT